MTQETVLRINSMKAGMTNFEERIASTLVDFRQFSSESGKNSNMTV